MSGNFSKIRCKNQIPKFASNTKSAPSRQSKRI